MMRVKPLISVWSPFASLAFVLPLIACTALMMAN